MTNTEMLIRMKEIREEIKQLKNKLNEKTAEGDALLGQFLQVDPGTNCDIIDIVEKTYNKIHD